MIDQNKRNTLKTLSLASASAVVPIVAAVAGSQAVASTTTQAGGLQVSIEAATALTPARLVIKNPNPDSVTLRHVSPGMVKSKGELFDINQIFDHQPLVLAPGQARAFAIDSMPMGSAEIANPGGAIASDMVSVTTRYSHAHGEGFATTRRMMLS